jgi:hypothetical protein
MGKFLVELKNRIGSFPPMHPLLEVVITPPNPRRKGGFTYPDQCVVTIGGTIPGNLKVEGELAKISKIQQCPVPSGLGVRPFMEHREVNCKSSTSCS